MIHIIILLVLASVNAHFLFSCSGNLLLFLVREEVWKGKFCLRSCAKNRILNFSIDLILHF